MTIGMQQGPMYIRTRGMYRKYSLLDQGCDMNVPRRAPSSIRIFLLLDDLGLVSYGDSGRTGKGETCSERYYISGECLRRLNF